MRPAQAKGGAQGLHTRRRNDRRRLSVYDDGLQTALICPGILLYFHHFVPLLAQLARTPRRLVLSLGRSGVAPCRAGVRVRGEADGGRDFSERPAEGGGGQAGRRRGARVPLARRAAVEPRRAGGNAAALGRGGRQRRGGGRASSGRRGGRRQGLRQLHAAPLGVPRGASTPARRADGAARGPLPRHAGGMVPPPQFTRDAAWLCVCAVRGARRAARAPALQASQPVCPPALVLAVCR